MNNNIPPAQLWIGTEQELGKTVITYLQEIFCTKGTCQTCITCRQITDQQYYGVLWIAPEKKYTLETIEPLFKTISYALEPGQQFFFIMQQADLLSTTCANALLKSIEEPPPGYHFILCAQRKEMILSTIRSRCTITEFFSTAQYEHDFLTYFYAPKQYHLTSFLTALGKAQITEQESTLLLDALLHYWIEKQKNALKRKQLKEYSETQKIISKLSRALIFTPMPGSTKLFWKNLFLSLR